MEAAEPTTDILDKIKFDFTAPREQMRENIITNIKRHLPQIQPHMPQEGELILAGGGPSLESEFDKLKELYESGVKVVAMNGTHDWLIERGIYPSAYIMIDPRETNDKWVQNPIDKCKYFIAAQVNPKVFDALEGQDVYIFHTLSVPGERQILDKHYFGKWHVVRGGSTVMTRSFHLLMMLGFRKFQAFGFDSCYIGDKHHAYDQEENNQYKSEIAKVGGREFRCTAEMYSQADEFMKISGSPIGQEMELVVHGDGLIANIIKTAATNLTGD